MSDLNMRKGDWVEVTSTEKEFEGSWYLATLVEPPPKSPTSGRALVRYEKFTDDAGRQLCEFVDAIYVRPIPPEELDVGGFEVNDAVEAKYNDGWWVGVVTKLLESCRYEVYFESASEVLIYEANDLRLHRLWVDGKWVRPEKQQNRSNGIRVHHQKSEEEGAPPSIVLESEFCTSKDETGIVAIDAGEERIPMEVDATESHHTCQQNETQIVESNNNRLQVDIAGAHVYEKIADDQQEGNHQPDNNQQPSSGAAESSLSKGVSLVNVESLETVKEVDATAVKQIGLETEALVKGNLFDDKLTWPFVKSSPLWEMVENLDVFKVTTQRPHFSTLNETKKQFREGLAIGLMVTFSNTYESICSLAYDNPNKKFEEILESLDDLQIHGFDVASLRARVNLLLSLKSDHELLLSEVEDAEKEKSKKLSEKEIYDEEVQELERKRAELEKLFADTMAKKEEKDIEIDRLQLYVETMNENIRKTIYEFNMNVAR